MRNKSVSNIILSIDPHWAYMILSGEKTFELRRKLPKNKPDNVVIYATNPIKSFIGEFEVDSIISLPLDELWDTVQSSSGVEEDEFFAYFKDCEVGHAYVVKNPITYQLFVNPKTALTKFSPPQNFKYLDDNDYRLIQHMSTTDNLKQPEKPPVILDLEEAAWAGNPNPKKNALKRLADDPISIISEYMELIHRVPTGTYKIDPNIPTPEYKTERSACFDLAAYLGPKIEKVETWNRILVHSFRSVAIMPEREKRGVYIEPGENILIPTGIVFNIPPYFKIQIHPRSGSSLKLHFTLANCAAQIDEDYVKMTYVSVHNNSEVRQIICDGDRLTQAEIVPVFQADFYDMDKPPAKKTSRDGGHGSTGLI